jgi:predicted membrane-bound dolichyl-phosphate-mannose-protein mannosyltransferase
MKSNKSFILISLYQIVKLLANAHTQYAFSSRRLFPPLTVVWVEMRFKQVSSYILLFAIAKY